LKSIAELALPLVITSCIGHLEKISYTDLPNIDEGHSAMSNTLIKCHHQYHIRKGSGIRGQLSSQGQTHTFQNSNFQLKAQILSLATTTISCLP
jgi:hypothetical protein